jgi:mRNA interferase HigB
MPGMRIIARRTLREFWLRHPDSEQPLRAWFAEVSRAAWRSPDDVKRQYRTASVLKAGRCVFNIGGNKYRLIVKANYVTKTLYIRFVGTHAQYDRVDADSV